MEDERRNSDYYYSIENIIGRNVEDSNTQASYDISKFDFELKDLPFDVLRKRLLSKIDEGNAFIMDALYKFD